MTGKTIKQIADELGVSKTAVRKKMSDEVKTKFAETVSGACGNQFPPVSGEFAVVIEVLKQQLEVKDRQIEQQQQSIKELTAALENNTSSLMASQVLHAGTMQSLPPIGGSPPEQQATHSSVEPDRKQVFWSKFFKK